MIYIGNHLSSSKGFEAMGKAALKLGANTFAFFTRNPRGGKVKEIDPADAKRLRSLMEEHHFGKLVAHAPYTMNVCAAKPDIREFSCNILKDDMERMEYLPGNYYNFHPGAHVGQGAEEAIPVIADALNFEELERIIELVDCEDKIGVCFDTCHTWDGGYDLVEDLDGVLHTFDQIIGLDRLKAVHLNDSMNVRDSHKDRHQKIGEGEIGAEALKRIVTHPLLAGRPFILETPNDDAGYAREIAMIKSWADESME